MHKPKCLILITVLDRRFLPFGPDYDNVVYFSNPDDGYSSPIYFRQFFCSELAITDDFGSSGLLFGPLIVINDQASSAIMRMKPTARQYPID